MIQLENCLIIYTDFFERMVIMGKDLKGKELGIGITQRKDGRYQARFTNRFGKRQTLYGKTLKEIKNLLHQETTNDIREENVKEANLTVNEWFDLWLRNYKMSVVKKTTLLKQKKEYNNQIKPILGNKILSEITSLDIVSLTSNMATKYTKGYVRDIHGLLYDLFETAYINDLCKKNPVRGTKCGGKPNKTIGALTTLEQVDFINASKDNFYYNAFIVQLNTGLRVGELFGLCIQDIDFDKEIIHIRHNLVMIRKDEETSGRLELSTPKTKSSIRDIPMNKICKEALLDQLEKRRSVVLSEEFNDLIFFTNKHFLPVSQPTYHRNISYVISNVNKTRMMNNQPLMENFGSHTFRHTFATRCFEAGIPPKTVQTLLGHSSLTMTMDIYTSVMKDKQVEDIQKFNVLMNSLCS